MFLNTDDARPIYESTEPVPVVVIKQEGYDICKMLNSILQNTTILIYIDIGGFRHRCVEFIPYTGKDIKVRLDGNLQVEVPWFSDFILKLGRNYQQFATMNK